MRQGFAQMLRLGVSRGFRPVVLGVLVFIALVATQILSLSRTHEEKVKALQEDTSMGAADITARFRENAEFLRQLTDDRNKSVLSEEEFRELTGRRLAQYPETIDIFYVNGNGDLTWSAMGSRTTSLHTQRLSDLTHMSRESSGGAAFTAYPESLLELEGPMRQNGWRVFSIVQPVIRRDKFLGFFAALLDFQVLADLAVKEEIASKYLMEMRPLVPGGPTLPDGLDLARGAGPHPDVDMNYRADARVIFDQIPFLLRVDRFRENGIRYALMLYGVTSFLALALFWTVWAMWRDNRASRELSTRLQAARASAEAASMAKSQLLANVSHELRTPVGAVQGYAELIAGSSGDLSEVLPQVAAIQRNCSNLLELIDDLLDLSRSEAGLLKLESSPVSLQHFLTAIQADMKPVAAERGLFFEVRALTNLPETIPADARRLRQILLNLLSNAFKFTPAGRVTMEVSYEASRRSLEVRVSDTGPGIPLEHQELIFEMFHQGAAGRRNRQGGMGIGLALSRRYAEAWGARLYLESSRAGVGSCFLLTRQMDRNEPLGPLVPMKFDGAGTGPRSALPATLPVVPGELEGLQILLVDDCADNLQIYSRFLQLAGAVVQQASSAEQAVTWLRARLQPPDVVVLDVQMPGMSGTEAATLLRQQGFRVPLIGLSASPLSDDCRAFSAFLLKPATSRQLVATILKVSGKTDRPTEGSFGGREGVKGKLGSSGFQTAVAQEALESLPLPVPSDLRKNFVAGLSRRAQAFADALRAGDFQLLRRLAHQLQGTARAYGFRDIAESASGLEEAGERDPARERAQVLLQLMKQTAEKSSEEALADQA